MNQRSADKRPRQILAEAVEQVKLAEAVGFEIAWFAEHHFSNYSLVPSPLVMCAYAAAITSNKAGHLRDIAHDPENRH